VNTMSVDISDLHSAMASSPLSVSTTTYPASRKQSATLYLTKNSSSTKRTTNAWALFSTGADTSTAFLCQAFELWCLVIIRFFGLLDARFSTCESARVISAVLPGTVLYLLTTHRQLRPSGAGVWETLTCSCPLWERAMVSVSASLKPARPRNQLLAAMSASDLALLQAHLKPIAMPVFKDMEQPNRPIDRDGLFHGDRHRIGCRYPAGRYESRSRSHRPRGDERDRGVVITRLGAMSHP
jgi:hypothetical protein